MSKIHPADNMTVAMARLLHDNETVFHGVASQMPMTAILLAKKIHAPNLVYMSIAGGVDAFPVPLPTETTTDFCLLHNSSAYISLAEMFDLCARSKMDVAFLGGVQIDAYGRINMSVIGDFWSPKVRLPGGAGSAVVMPTAKRSILWRAKHDPKTFVSKLPFVTADGNCEFVVTPYCIFKREDGLLKVWRIFEGITIDKLKAETGFGILTTKDFTSFAEPSEKELAVLKEIDPNGARYREFQT